MGYNKVWGSQKLYTDFQLLGGRIPKPYVVQGSTLLPKGPDAHSYSVYSE